MGECDIMALPANWYELRHSRRRKGKDVEMWRGVRIFSGPSASVDDAETEMWNSDGSYFSWTVNSHVMRVTEVDIIEDDPKFPGNSRIIVGYITNYNPASHPLSGATLSITSRGRIVKALEDFSLKRKIESKPDEGGNFYKPVRGSNFRIEHTTVFVVKTAYEQGGIQWGVISNKVGKVNSNEMTKLGISPGEALLIKASIPKYFLYDSTTTIVPIDYYFWKNDEGWNKQLKVGRFRRAAYAYGLRDARDPDDWLDSDGNVAVDWAAAKKVTVLTDLPNPSSDADVSGYEPQRKLFKETSFADLYNLLTWF